MSNHVIIIHGDLLTKERIDSIHEARSIEATPKHRFDFVVFVPGLFHFKMACADALWRIWVQPKGCRNDVNVFYQHIGILRPREDNKFATKPGFRRMHDVIHHDLWASILNCWEVEASKQNSAWNSLEAFAKSKPSWEVIVEMSEAIVKKYVATTSNLSEARGRSLKERDKHFENQALRNRDELLYVDLCHAMNGGDVGHVEASLLSWIYIFKVTGKHKYAYQMTHFKVYMRHIYTDSLRQIIRLNWLCNPTGKVFKFRAVDWLVERNNLYTKVIFAGKGSNWTIDHIVKESLLIELYRECHVLMENAFYIHSQTINHALPNMTKTLEKLCEEIKKNSPHIFKPGREADCVIHDGIMVGMELLMDNKAVIEDLGGEEGEEEVGADDLAAE
ncbi:hypothetical protein PAXINDRAFT_87711 [Paxillus involutus ATCC 200175]|uniref:DUF6589 domain-containing protein n=1 Tax=Paxillus involutus ATCC 200175 TaxID=664439 RepID=A0A0C9TQ31_PAXIN|nr:hypothetical protein PAXINDRAFT_87711 [Paxillus involutus ATCC 200175]